MWYYSIEGQQQGPVDDAALEQLITNGTVTPDTFVWKDGLAEWTQLRQVRGFKNIEALVGDAATSTCSMCGKRVGADNLIELLGVRVCAACKPMALQTLREGGTPVGNIPAWCDGKKVVTHDKKSLPARCYKCNQPVTAAPLKRKLYWHPPAYYLLIFIHIIVYVIVAMAVRKRATVDVYLCSRHAQRRKYFIIGGWGGTILGLTMIITGSTMDESAILIISGVVLFGVSLIGGLIGASLARATRIKNDVVWMGGAGRDFLASLPPWP